MNGYSAICIADADAVSILIILIPGAVSVFALLCIAYRVDLAGDVAVKVAEYPFM